MSKRAKILLGIATFWPIAYGLCFLGFAFYVTLQLEISGQTNSVTNAIFQNVVFPLHVFTIALLFGMVTFYCLNVGNNEAVPDDKKGLWAIALIGGNIVAMPIYWYQYVWRRPTDRDAQQAETTKGRMDDYQI